MNISAKVYPKRNEKLPSLRAYAQITLSDGTDEFAITNLTVQERADKSKMFVSMPQRKGKNSDGNIEYYDTAYPLSKELREKITLVVLEEYNKEISLSKNNEDRAVQK